MSEYEFGNDLLSDVTCQPCLPICLPFIGNKIPYCVI